MSEIKKEYSLNEFGSHSLTALKQFVDSNIEAGETEFKFDLSNLHPDCEGGYYGYQLKIRTP